MAERDIGALIAPDQIRLLLAIAKRHSFSGAAEELGITQSSISQQVKRLETLAGFSLFRRNRRGIELTNQGEVVIYYARAMARLTEEMRRHLDQAGAGGKVSIGMGEDFCRTALPAFLTLLALNFPEVELQIVSGTYDILAQAINARSVDIVVMRRWDRFPDTKLLWSDSAVWHGHASFASGVPNPVPLVLPLAPNPTRATIIDTLGRHDRTWKVRFESVGIAGIEAALQCGLGLIGVPRSMHFHGVPTIGPESGLPPLPDIEFVMWGPLESANGVVHAVAEILHQLAGTGFRAPRIADELRSQDA